jgi:hypothetical protein
MRPTLVAVAVLFAAGCLLPGDPVERLDLEVALSTTQVHADTGLTITLTATNRYWRNIRLETRCGEILDYYLIAPGDSVMRPWPGWVCPDWDEPQVIDVAPGEAIVRRLRVVPRPVIQGRPAVVSRWPAGRYQVIGFLMDQEGGIAREAAPLTFDLVCRDPAWPAC